MGPGAAAPLARPLAPSRPSQWCLEGPIHARCQGSVVGVVPVVSVRGLTLPPVARYDMGMIRRECPQCGNQMPRTLDRGRILVYCTNACRQKAYRARGGQASGTTGAERARRIWVDL